mgnify:FL=1
MAKDVDLSSKEWRDIVFEGKNKEYGAYTLRAASASRHNKSVIIVLSILIPLLIVLALFYKGVFGKADEEELAISTEQEITNVALEEEEIIEEEEEEFVMPEMEQEVIAPEEVANEQQVTNILVTEDENFEDDKKVKNTDEVMELSLIHI